MTDSRRRNSQGTPSWQRLGSAFALLPLACQGSDLQGRGAASPSSADDGRSAQVPAPGLAQQSNSPSRVASRLPPAPADEMAERSAAADGVAPAPEKDPSRHAGGSFHLEVLGPRESFRSTGIRSHDPEVFYLEESGQLLADGRRIETWMATTRAALERFKARAKAAGLEVKVYESR